MLPHGSKGQRVGAEQMGKSFIWRLSTNLWRTFGRHANEKAYILPASWLHIATCQCVHVNITHLQTFDLSNEYLNVGTFVLALTHTWKPYWFHCVIYLNWRPPLENGQMERVVKTPQSTGSHTNLCHVVLIVTIQASIVISHVMLYYKQSRKLDAWGNIGTMWMIQSYNLP